MSTSNPHTASIFPIGETVGVTIEPRVPKSQHSLLLTGRLRRSTLVMLRWTAIIGQGLALFVVSFILDYDYPVLPAVLMVAFSVCLNIGITMRLSIDRRVGDLEAMFQLGYDLLQLAGLLWLTGGMNNPFSLLFLAPVVTSATTLSRSVLATLGSLSAALSFGLLFHSLPLPWNPTGSFSLPFDYTFGIWLALMVGMVFTSTYTWRAAKESRRMSEALAATEAVLAQEQKLAALGALAAAAAHELGTPLATIQITAKELVRELGGNVAQEEDLKLLISQSQRCRDILQQLAFRGDEGDIIHDNLTLETLIEEAVTPFRGLGPKIDIIVRGEGGVPVLGRQAELLYGLKNFIENAVGFADRSVTVRGQWSERNFEVKIEDDGPGFDPTILGKLGEPYVSGRDEHGDGEGGDVAGGLGLGFFIAKTLIERTNGKVVFGNYKEGGAWVQLKWSRTAS